MIMKFLKKASIFAIFILVISVFAVVESFAAHNRGAPSVVVASADINVQSFPISAPRMEQITQGSPYYQIERDVGSNVILKMDNMANIKNAANRSAERRQLVYDMAVLTDRRQIMQTRQIGEVFRI